MKFGDRLNREGVEKWQGEYINYKGLKKKLKDIVHTEHVDPDNAKLLELQRLVFQGGTQTWLARRLALVNSLLSGALCERCK